MNEKENTGVSASGSKPGKFWLWGLAVIQLPAVMLLTWAGIEDTMVKMAGFVILLLCGSMDIKAVKKAGCQVPRWWWGLAVFLPPVYMVCRVLRTDRAPSQRMTRFAPAVVWVLLLGILLAVSMSPGSEVDLNATATEILKSGLAEHFEEHDVGAYLKVGAIRDVSLIHQSGNRYAGLADVQLRTRQGIPASEVVRYDLQGTFDGDQLLLEFTPLASHVHKLGDLLEKAGYEE